VASFTAKVDAWPTVQARRDARATEHRQLVTLRKEYKSRVYAKLNYPVYSIASHIYQDFTEFDMNANHFKM